MSNLWWSLKRTFRGIFQAFGQFTLACTLAGLTLTLPCLIGTVSLSLSNSINAVPVLTEITVFTQRSATPRHVKTLEENIRGFALVQATRTIPKKEALELVNKSLGIKESKTTTNPLPDIIIVTCPNAISSQDIARLAAEIKKMPSVDSVAYDDSWSRHLHALMAAASIAATILVFLVLLLVILVIAASVRLTTLAQQDEIRLLHIFGATNGFIKRPYVWRGAITMAAASLISLAVTSGATTVLAEPVNALAALYSTPLHLSMPPMTWMVYYVLGATLVGALIGNLAARDALRKVQLATRC